MAMCAPSSGLWDYNGYPKINSDYSKVRSNNYQPKINVYQKSKPRKAVKYLPKNQKNNKKNQKHSQKHKKSLLPKRRLRHKGQMTVVLDLDETLIHSIFLSDVEAQLSKSSEPLDEKEIKSVLEEYKEKADFVLDDGGGIAVTLRPGLRTFLRKLSQQFEVVVFTAADREYAQPLLKHIDPERKLIPYRLYREHTVKYNGTKYVKDLRLLGRNLNRIVLVDNNIMAMRASPDNSILIDDFYGEKEDRQLEVMWTVLLGLDDLPDVRPCLIESLSIAQRIEEILETSEPILEPGQRNGSYTYVENVQPGSYEEPPYQGRLSKSARSLLRSSF